MTPTPIIVIETREIERSSALKTAFIDIEEMMRDCVRASFDYCDQYKKSGFRVTVTVEVLP